MATLVLGAEVSGADISSDGSVIAMRGYQTVWMWTRGEGQTIAGALAAEPCEGQSPTETQGESVAFDADLLVLDGERRGYRLRFTEFRSTADRSQVCAQRAPEHSKLTCVPDRPNPVLASGARSPSDAFRLRRCPITSYSTRAAATEMLKLSVKPPIGTVMTSSAPCLASTDNPSSSLPKTRAQR